MSSNLFVYALTYLLLKFNTNDSSDDDLNRDDAPKFMYLTIVVCAVGLLFQVVFHLGTREKQNQEETDIQVARSSYTNQRTKDWKDYLKSPSFWVLALLYMNTRLVVNMSQVYLTMYVSDTVQLDKVSQNPPFIGLGMKCLFQAVFFEFLAFDSIDSFDMLREWTYRHVPS